MMKLLEDLTPEELQNLYSVNKKLQEMATEQATNSADYFISDILSYFSGIHGVDYNIGYPGSYMSVKPHAIPDFIRACQDMQKSYCILSDETAAKIDRAEARADFYKEARNGYETISDDKYLQLEKWIDRIISDAAGEIARSLDDEYNAAYTDEAARDNLECLIDNIGSQYETDGRYIYEIDRRKYA